MQQDNIKDFAIAAFRYRGHLKDTDILSLDEIYINMAVTSTIRHLEIERDYIAIEGVKRVYYQLPLGNLKRGLLTENTKRVAIDMHIEERTLWRHLARARNIFNCYYEKFTDTKLSGVT